MTDHIRTLTVVLDQDFRDDDVQEIANAIRLIRHVSSVKLGEPLDMRDYVLRDHARRELRDKILEALYDD